MAHLLKVGADEAVIGQRVWYARWLLANANPLAEKRRDEEFQLAELCEDMVRGRRKLPDEWIWKENWFQRLLPKKKELPKGVEKVRTVIDECDAGLLGDRFTRLSNDTVREFAAHKYLTADLLPPLAVDEFPGAETATPRGGYRP